MSTAAPVAPSPAAPAASPAPALSGVQEPWVKEFIAPDYSLNHKALDRLPEHLSGMKETLGKYKTFEDAMVGWQNQQVMLGKKALAPLPADAPEAARLERKALLDTINGVPKEAKEYGLVKPKDTPDGQWNQSLADAVSTWAHKNSVAPSALKDLMTSYNAIVEQGNQQTQQYETEFWNQQEQTFQATLKRDGITPDRASALVEKGALALGLDLNNEQTKTFLKGSDARLMALRHAIAIGEDKAVTGEATSTQSEANPEALAKDAVGNPANPLNGPYWNREGKYSRAQHEAAVAKVNGWLQQAAGKKR